MAEGGGGILVPVDPQWYETTFGAEEWRRALGQQDSKSEYLRRRWVLANVPGATLEGWNDPATRLNLIARALQIWRNLKLTDPRSDFSRRVANLERHGKLEKKLGPAAAAAVRVAQANAAAARSGSTQPRQPDPDLDAPTDPTASGPEPAWIRLVRIVAEQLQRYREQQAAREQQRAQKRSMRMSLSDTIGDVLGSVTQVGTAVLPQLLAQRAQDAQVKQALKLAKLSSGFSASGVPVAGGAASLLALLGEQGAMESPDLLESLGMATGLEGAIEREATFYVPTPTGVRAVPEIQARNPVTGRINTWKNMGRPVLFSGDLATCKRVNKISRRVGQVARRRGLLPRRRR